jgi:uroporphyrinogen decarboxylase
MNARERFLRTMHFEPVDRPYLLPQWVFPDTLRRWYHEGLPPDVHFNTYFGFDRYEYVPLNLSPLTTEKEEVLEEDAETKVVRDPLGGVRRVWKYRDLGMPQWLEFPIKGREDWERFKTLLNPDSPCRYPQYWDDLKHTYRDRDYPLGVSAGSYYGWLRNWVGMEHLAVLYYDDPELVREMTDYIADFVLQVISRAVEEVDLDFAGFWEDMAMKTGSLISPQLFREFMLPNYKKLTAYLREHGIDVFLVDCDGNTDELIPLWLEGGVNGIYPIEVAAGCDALGYRRRYGQELILIGGIDKRALSKDLAAVRHEVMGKVPELVAGSGYVPFVDHAVPPDVSFRNFCYYLELVKGH